MNYDKKRTGLIYSSSISCAFNEARVEGRRESRVPRNAHGYPIWGVPNILESNKEHEDRLWNALCEILTSAETRPVLVPTTDRESVWRDLIAMCPHAELITDAKSKHGNYRAQLWLFDLRKGQYK